MSSIYGEPLLFQACRYNRYDEVVKLVNHQHDVNMTDQRGNSPLSMAIVRSPEIAIYLLEHGADPNTIDHQGNPILMISIIKGYINVVEYLLTVCHKSQLYINPPYDRYLSPIPLKYGTKLNNDHCCLYYAAKHNNKYFTILLLERGASPNDYNWNGETPLHIATKLGHLNIVKMLLDYNADQTLPTRYDGKRKNYSSVDIAKRTGSRIILELFKQYECPDIKEPGVD